MSSYTWTAVHRIRHAATYQARRQALAENVEWLLATGTAPCVIAHRVGYQRPESLQRHLYRIGRRDLAEQLTPALPRRPR